MAAEKKGEASLLVSVCRFFMKEGMPNMALQKSHNRASATPTTELESVKYVKSVTADFYVPEEKNAMGPFNYHMKKQVIIVKPQIPDLNQLPPENEGPSMLVIIQDHAKIVEVDAGATTTGGKRKTTEASTSGVKRFKNTATSNNEGKDIIEIEDSENEE